MKVKLTPLCEGAWRPVVSVTELGFSELSDLAPALLGWENHVRALVTRPVTLVLGKPVTDEDHIHRIVRHALFGSGLRGVDALYSNRSCVPT